MSAGRIRFLQAQTRAREPGPDGADRNPQSRSGILVAQLKPGTEDENVLFPAREPREPLKRAFHLTFVVDSQIGLVAKLRSFRSPGNSRKS